jgi:hypothetical protein
MSLSIYLLYLYDRREKTRAQRTHSGTVIHQRNLCESSTSIEDAIPAVL